MHTDTLIISAVSVFALLLQGLLHRAERRDLYNRIQAGTLREYQQAVGAGSDTSRYPATKGINPIKKIMDKQYKPTERSQI